MYFIPAGYIHSKQKHRFKRFLLQKKSLQPFHFPYYSSAIISKQYGFVTGRRLEALRKTLIKSLSFKIAGVFTQVKPGAFRGAAFGVDLAKFSKNVPRSLKIGFKRNSNLTHPVTKKGILTRMGKGKGKLLGWFSYQRPGIPLFHFPSISFSFSKKNQLNPNNFLIRTGTAHRKSLVHKQLAFVGPFNSRIPFRCKNYRLNFNLTYNHKQRLLC